jgi:hypothetical protein
VLHEDESDRCLSTIPLTCTLHLTSSRHDEWMWKRQPYLPIPTYPSIYPPTYLPTHLPTYLAWSPRCRAPGCMCRSPRSCSCQPVAPNGTSRSQRSRGTLMRDVRVDEVRWHG